MVTEIQTARAQDRFEIANWLKGLVGESIYRGKEVIEDGFKIAQGTGFIFWISIPTSRRK